MSTSQFQLDTNKHICLEREKDETIIQTLV